MNQFENITLNENESKSLLQEPFITENELNECCNSCHFESEDHLSDDQEVSEGCEVVSDAESSHDENSGEAKMSHRKKEKKNSSQYDVFLKEFESAENAESKLRLTIQFMEYSLSQAASPHFKSFWDARTICLQLFKENLSQPVRAEMWNKYTELSKEARRLKEILDEQSTFAAEQIEIAIQALETDLDQMESNLEKASPVDFGIEAKSLKEEYAFYEQIQRELNILNTQASRINALRKELIRTEMRIKIKNKFFQRLSLIGDKIFPRRKELIKALSDQFSADVDAFIQESFGKNKIEEALFFLREEIKALQGLAKILTLNTHSFTHTRMRLSNCWDQLKNVEKERKKERAQQKAYYKENVDSVLAKISSFKESFASGELSLQDASNALDEIASYMRSVELGRDEVKALKEEMHVARKPFLEKLKAEEELRQAEELQRELEKKKVIDNLKLEVEQLLENCKSYDVDQIVKERDQMIEKINASKMSKIEKNEIEKRLKSLKDLITDKQEALMMSLSDDDKQALAQLVEVLNQRKQRRLEIKNQLDTLRKANRSSGFDFEQAMKNNELINEEKERLNKIDLGVKEIELMIEDLKNKVRS